METLLSSPGAAAALSRYGREPLKEELRHAMASGETASEALIAWAEQSLTRRFAPTLVRAINATGVLLHTNLGRSPLSDPAREAVRDAAAGYSTLEYVRDTGERGHRQDHVRAGTRALFGVADALAVNNNAAAVLLVLSALARGRKVLLSRGELVAIGGSFKIPEILQASGALLCEVGTTNRTSIEDYRRALSSDVALILTVHPSNYEIRGYTARPDPNEIALLARQAGVPWAHDQGTGCVVPLSEFGVEGEPTVGDCLAGGADLVTFSGDKLFSGPQAGLVIGRGDLVLELAAHPLARALRPDKLTLAALAATTTAWIKGEWREFPIYRAAGVPLGRLEERGEKIREGATGSSLTIGVTDSESLFGGGTSPEKKFPSRALAITHPRISADQIAARLRAGSPAVIGRIEQDRLLLDLRSIAPEEDGEIATALQILPA